MNNIQKYIWPMQIAREEAEIAYRENEVPVGAVVIDSLGNIISKAHNEKESDFNPCGHAEILALQKAGKSINNWRLQGCTLVVTLEPCLMCINAAVHSRVAKVVFGTYDFKAGALSLGYNFHKNDKLNHKFEVIGGLMHFENSRLLSKFFREKRNYYKK